MEQKINEVIPRQMATGSFKDPYADEILSEDEIELALRDARRKKAVDRKAREYAELISKPKEYPKITLVEFKEAVIQKIRSKIPDYILDEFNSHNFDLLSLYFSGDPLFETIDDGRFSLKKGIAMLGPIGCGKTSMMLGFNINPVNSFVPISCRKVASEYAMKDYGGSLTIDRYSGLTEVPAADFFGQKFVGRLFDDLGTENVKKHFGNESNVMEEIILNRYDNIDLVGKTHITTNLSADQVEELYGPRVRSRFKQMFNMIVFDPKQGDRRK